MNKSLVLIVSIIALIAVASCSTENEKISPRPVKIHRLDIAMRDYATMSAKDRVAVLDTLGDGVGALFAVIGLPVTDSALIEYSRSRAVAVFTPDVEKRLPSLVDIEQTIGVMSSNARELLPLIPKMDYYAIVSPYRQSIYVGDSIVLVGLNHYLGIDYPGYSGFEQYQLIMKTPKHLPYDVTEAILRTAYPYSPTTDSTVLNRLLYEGAVVEAMMRLLPDADLAEILCTDTQGLQWLQANESQAWNALISRKLLYSMSQVDADRLVSPSPATTILHPESPGQAGRYIGYRIVSSYLNNHTETSLADILTPSFYNSTQTLIDSRYSGR